MGKYTHVVEKSIFFSSGPECSSHYYYWYRKIDLRESLFSHLSSSNEKSKTGERFSIHFSSSNGFPILDEGFCLFYPSTSLLARKKSKLPIFFPAFTNHLHLHPSISLMATFLRLCTKLFSEQQKSLPSVSRKGLVTPYEARMRKQKTPHDNKTDFSVSFFIRCLGSLIRTNA